MLKISSFGKNVYMIGRIEEKKTLTSLLKKNESQFVAVLGRRRVGKTYLVRETFDYNFTFQHTGKSNNAIKPSQRKKAQLEKFRESLKEYGLEVKNEILDWEEAFGYLKEIIRNSKDKKKVIFIDELSWMDTKSSGLISALESFWNGFVMARKEKDVVLIVCASATYWMIDNIVNSKGGLHNRLTCSIFLKPFCLGECAEYARSMDIKFNSEQLLNCYMIFGGIPYYWSLLERSQSLSQNVDRLLFSENAPLKDEFENLYAALFAKPDKYIEIIKALSATRKGITRDEISEMTKIDSSGSLSTKLLELENCGFIRKYVPFGYKNKNCLYQLIDNFTIFYYQFLDGKTNDEHFFSNHINSPLLNAWSGIAFERVCLEHIPQIKNALGISGVYTEVNSWQCKKDLENGIFGSQIDLLIVRKDQVINLCEMKYSSSQYIIDSKFAMDMRKKVSDLQNVTKTKYSIYPTLVTTNEVEDNEYKNELQSIITASDLFKVL